MAGDLKNYDFSQVSVIVGGVQITGFADGDDVVQVKMNEDAFKLTIGADGEPTRSKSNNKSGSITLKLQATSDSNDVLNGFLQADTLGNVAAGVVPVLVKDSSGRSLHAAEKAWVKKGPDSPYGASVGSREWELHTGELINTYGGN